MKRATFFIAILALVFALTACGGASKTTTTTSDGTSSANTGEELSLPTQLLIGTLKLEGTDLAVDAQQASKLLPLWQAYNELMSSDTAAQAEIDAVISQIQGAMTQQQIQAITDMKLTRQDELSTMQTLGLVNIPPNASGTPGAPSGQGYSGRNFGGGGDDGFVPGAGGGAGGYPGGGAGGYTGGGPSGGGGYPGEGGGQGFNPQQMATAQARRAQSGGAGNRVPTPLLNALIDLLQKRAQP